LKCEIMKKTKAIAKQNTFTEFLLYTAPDGKVKVEIFLRDENLWLTQKRMADLFGVGIPAINKHLKNIFESGELQEDSVISILETTADDLKDKLGWNNWGKPFIYGEPISGYPSYN
jgi:hypothetical protein